MGAPLTGIFGRGETAYGGRTIDANNLLFGNQIGMVRTFDDQAPNSSGATAGVAAAALSPLVVTCILLRNKTGGTLLPKQPVLFSGTVVGETGATVTQSATPNVHFAIVDEYLPAAGVPANDVFWAVIKGPTTALFTTVSVAKAAGGLYVQPSATDNGKLDFTTLAPGSATIAMNAALYGGTAVTEGAIADAATQARIHIVRNRFGQ